jgi:hypothetical protein
MEQINGDDSNQTATRVSNSIFNSRNLLFSFDLSIIISFWKGTGILMNFNGMIDAIAIPKKVFYNRKIIICSDKTEEI